MTDITERLAALATDPPPELEMNTALAAGAADGAALADSPFGDLWISWSRDGITAVSPRFETDSFEDFASIHRRVTYEASGLPTDLVDPIHGGQISGGRMFRIVAEINMQRPVSVPNGTTLIGNLISLSL